jgi:hypothetical protein
MAENTSQKQLELEKEKLLTKQKELKAIVGITDAQKIQLKETEKAIKLADKRIAQAKKKAELQKIETKEFTSFSKKFRAMSQDVQNQLKGTSTSASVYLSIGREISKEKARQAKYADKEDPESQRLLANSQERESVMGDITHEAAIQAKATQTAADGLKGISDVERRIKDIKESTGLYNAIQKKQLIDQLELTEKLRIKEERLKTIKEEQQGMFEALPESIQGAIGAAKKFGNALKNGALPIVLLASLLAATLSSFTKLDESAEEFRKETGLTNTQTNGIKSDANKIVGEFANLGVNAEKVFDTVSALKSEFSDIASFSKETTAALTVLNANFGVAADTAAKVQSQFESIGGLSSETAASVQMQVANMANLAGVAPKKVFEDIAENAEATSTFFKGDLTALTKNAVQARRMGTSLKEQVALAEKLLDFEAGIEDELVAATFVGGQFNLSRARGLAMEGKLAEANAETLSQLQRSGDFRKQDYFTQRQLAKAAGMTVEEINKQLNAQDKLSKLNTEDRKRAEEAISQGLDITNINEEQLAQKTEEFAKQKEIQGSLTNVKNTFDGLIASVGSTFLPLMQGIASVFEFISSNTAGLVGFVGTLATLFGVIYGIKLRTLAIAKLEAFNTARAASGSITGAIASIFGGQGKIPIVGAVLAAAMVGALFAAISKGASAASAGDVMSPAYGRTQVSTKEGGLFELSPNDDLVAAPGAAAALANGGTQQIGGTQQSVAPQINLSVLAAPLNVMIAEIKALRADMASGKIAVHMDGAKVTAGVSNQVNKSTRNNFAIA